MKKNRIALFILMTLAIVAAYFYFTNSGSTIKEELRDFAVEDTAAVDKIFMADKSGSQVLLERKSAAEWMINGKSRARADAVNLLLYTMKAMEVRSPVGKAARDFIIRNMAAQAVKVEVYQHGKLFKTFYVGGATQDQLGTYMYLQHSAVPFIMHIPGFDGYLTPRFITAEAEWKIKSIFGFKQGEIETLTIQNTRQPAQSFQLKKARDDRYSLFSLPDLQPQAYRDTATIQSYLASYQFINYEKPVDKNVLPGVDSTLQAGPIMTIDALTVDGKSTRVELFLKPAEANKAAHHQQDGKLLPFDPDRMIARINGDTSLVLVQYFVFDKLMVTLEHLKNYTRKPNP